MEFKMVEELENLDLYVSSFVLFLSAMKLIGIS